MERPSQAKAIAIRAPPHDTDRWSDRESKMTAILGKNEKKMRKKIMGQQERVVTRDLKKLSYRKELFISRYSHYKVHCFYFPVCFHQYTSKQVGTVRHRDHTGKPQLPVILENKK